MPAGSGQPIYDERGYPYRTRPSHAAAEVNGDESAASILQSVKEQEAQFEQLTRELEAERQSVANQLERCKLGSETASMSSISSTDESFHWRHPQPQEQHHFDEESDAESKMSGSQLVDSCLRVLQERGLMNVGEDPLEYLGEDSAAPPRPPPSSEHFQSPSDTYNSTMNGPTSYYDRNMSNSPNPSVQSGSSLQQPPVQQRTVTTVTKVVTTRQVQSQSPVPQSSYSPYSNYVSTFRSSQSALAPPSPAQGSLHSPGGSQGAATPTRFMNARNYEPMADLYSGPGPNYDRGDGYGGADHPHNYTDSFDQQYPYPSHDKDPYGNPSDSQRSVNNGPLYSSAAYGDRLNEIPPADQDYHPSPMREDPYRSTPPVDDSYRNPASDSYSRLPPMDGDPYGPTYDRNPSRTAGLDDDLYPGSYPRDGSRHPSDQYSDREPSESGRYMPPRDDDPYGDARPQGGRYGQPFLDGGRPGRTPSPGAGSDRPGTQGVGEEPYGSQPGLPYDQDTSQSHIPYTVDLNNQPRSQYDPDRGSHSQLPFDPDHGSLSRFPYEPDRDSQSRLPFDKDEPRFDERAPFSPEYGDVAPQDVMLHAPMPLAEDPYAPDVRGRSPSLDSNTRDQRWRNPDLPEVIDFLSHPSNAIKANAAAYLQHLCYMDDPVKAKTRALGGIPALVELVNSEIPEVHRAACGALRNLSYGRANDDNKRAIKNADGIPALVRLLRKSPDNDVRELVTGTLWNLSSCQELKKPIIDDGLTVIVNNVIIPHSGWDRNMDEDANRSRPKDIYWSTVFRNASGILRNISSDGEYARKKLRECDGLVDSILFIVRAAIGKNDIDNKSVENCVCVLRNLSYACQEVEDPAYLKRRSTPKQQPNKGESTGCFGGNKKKKEPYKIDQRNRPRTEPIRGMELLWQPEVVSVYLALLSDCSNPETLEAAAGAIQNLAACEWQPSVDIRATVRKDRGLPIIVELLSIEADRVVSAAATALRNLALDQRNKDLIGKYAMKQLVQKLPQDNKPADFPVSDDTITAVQATLYEVIKKNADFAQCLVNDGGVERLMYINKSRGRFSMKVVKFASSILYAMWQFKELHPEYRNKGWKESDFVSKTMAARGGPSSSANNTLNRPRMDLGGGGMGYNNGALQPGNNQHTAGRPGQPPMSNHYVHMDDPSRTPEGTGYMDDRDHYTDDRDRYMDDRDRYLDDRDRYHDERENYMERDDRLRPEDVPMTHMGSSADAFAPGYASIDPHRGERHDRDDYRPPGGVPLFPNLHAGHQQPQPQVDPKEPLYAQVNKQNRKRHDPHVRLDGGPSEGGADSWV